MVREKITSKIQVKLDSATSDILNLLSTNVRGQVARNAFLMYLRSVEGRQFYGAFGIDLEAEMVRKGLSEGAEPNLFEQVHVEPQKIHGKDTTSDAASSLFRGFDRTQKA
jgi:hypothetical protein